MRLAAMLAMALLGAAGCGGGSGQGNPDGGGPDLAAGDGVAEQRAEAVTEVGAENLVGDLAAEERGELPLPPGPESRGWQVKRGVVHLHSAYSHDGCGPDGYEDFGGPDPACNAQLRSAACAFGMDFLMLTDHPGHLKDHTHEEGLLFWPEEGDELIADDLGRPFANRLTCPEGSQVSHSDLFVGTEGSKQMPVAMAGPIDPAIFGTSVADSTPLEQAQAALALVHDLGGYMYACHTEQKEISAQRIIDLPLDGMEIYNIHANLMAMLDSMDNIFAIEPFLKGAVGGPAPDLAMLIFLYAVEPNIVKFDQVAPHRRISFIAATDIHRNVEIPALCPGGIPGSLCEGFADKYPNFAEFAIEGGPLPLADGDRVDSYARSFRWLSNRALAAGDDPQAVREAIGRGRSYSTFDLLGWPGPFDLYLEAGGEVVEMGEETPFVAGSTLRFNTPRLTEPPWGMAGIDFGTAQVTCRLFRTTLEEVTVVTEVSSQGQALSVPLPGAGTYRLECQVVPHHLAPILPGVEYLAERSYPYLYANAIFVR